MNVKVQEVSEFEKRVPRDRKDDTQMVKKIFRELEVEAEIENVIRLVENKNRLTKVVLKDFGKRERF